MKGDDGDLELRVAKIDRALLVVNVRARKVLQPFVDA